MFFKDSFLANSIAPPQRHYGVSTIATTVVRKRFWANHIPFGQVLTGRIRRYELECALLGMTVRNFVF